MCVYDVRRLRRRITYLHFVAHNSRNSLLYHFAFVLRKVCSILDYAVAQFLRSIAHECCVISSRLS